MALNVEGSHFGIADFDALGIAALVNVASDSEAGIGGSGADQLYDDVVADERFAAPVLGDVGKEAVLDAVPLCALPRRIDVVGANPTRQLSLQPEALGADQEATNGLKHFGKRSFWESAGHTGRSKSEHH